MIWREHVSLSELDLKAILRFDNLVLFLKFKLT